MKRIVILTMLICTCAISNAQGSIGRSRIGIDYDVDFQYVFDNLEFAASNDMFMPSETWHSARLSPGVSIRIDSANDTHQTLHGGIDVWKHMGEEYRSYDYFCYYDLRTRTRRGIFEGAFGVYPRALSEGDYSLAMRSEKRRTYDLRSEGMILKYRTRKLYIENGLDWSGKYGEQRRERFEIYSAFEWTPVRNLCIGFTSSVNHLAGSMEIRGVVDNILVNPMARIDLSEHLRMEEFSVKAGAIIGYQRDRVASASPYLPVSGEIGLDIQKRRAGMSGILFYGQDLMPLYAEYSDLLYYGSPMYRTGSLYSRAELFYEPLVSRYLHLRASAIFHFRENFVGWQQRLSLIFNIEKQKTSR